MNKAAQLSLFSLISLIAFGACATDSPFSTPPEDPARRSTSPSSTPASIQVIQTPLRSVSAKAPALVSQEAAVKLDPSVRIIPATDLFVYPVFQALGQNGEMNSLVVTRDGKKAYIGGSDGSVVFTSLSKPDDKNNQARPGEPLLARKLLQSSRPIDALALSADEKYLAVSQYANVSIVDLASGKIAREMTQISGRVLSLAWDPRGELLLMGRASGEVFAWRLAGTPFAGRDSNKAIEQYGTPGGASIIRLVFHPSGRAFLAADRDGSVMLWRLLRTERELGLRDESAVIDEDRTGTKDLGIGKAGSAIEDMWLDPEEQEVFVSGVNGKISHWKLRGVEAGEDIDVGADSIGSIQGIDLKRSGGKEARFLIAAGRGQMVKAYCREVLSPELGADDKTGVPVEVSKKEDGGNSGGGTRIVDGRLILGEDTSKKTADRAEKPLPTAAKLIARSVTLKDPITQLRSESAMLWGTQKKGNLVIFDARPVLSAGADNCPVL